MHDCVDGMHGLKDARSVKVPGSSVRLTKPPFELGPKHVLGQSISVLDFYRKFI